MMHGPSNIKYIWLYIYKMWRFTVLPLKIHAGVILGSLILNKLSIACSADALSDTRHETAEQTNLLIQCVAAHFFLLCRILKSLFSELICAAMFNWPGWRDVEVHY
jgi:hypothetical protein